jgi:hypothetical protein
MDVFHVKFVHHMLKNRQLAIRLDISETLRFKRSLKNRAKFEYPSDETGYKAKNNQCFLSYHIPRFQDFWLKNSDIYKNWLWRPYWMSSPFFFLLSKQNKEILNSLKDFQSMNLNFEINLKPTFV